jgi:putative NADH-flavin reductase
MKLFIVGATGRTGQLVLRRAISRGHTVTAIVRKPGTLDPHERLRTIPGDPLRVDDLAPGLAGSDVVISCLGQHSSKDGTLLLDAAGAMLEAMLSVGARRYLVVSQGLLFPNRNPIIFLLRRILARQVADSRAMEDLVRASDADWTIVRPPRLQEGGVPRGYRLRVGAQPAGAWAMQRVDLATFLVDEAENPEHIRAILGITSQAPGAVHDRGVHGRVPPSGVAAAS